MLLALLILFSIEPLAKFIPKPVIYRPVSEFFNKDGECKHGPTGASTVGAPESFYLVRRNQNGVCSRAVKVRIRGTRLFLGHPVPSYMCPQ